MKSETYCINVGYWRLCIEKKNPKPKEKTENSLIERLQYMCSVPELRRQVEPGHTEPVDHRANQYGAKPSHWL